MAKREDLILGSDNVVELCNLRDTTDGTLQAGATVTALVLDDVGAPVSGVPNPITFTEVAGKTGNYVGTIPSTAGYVLSDKVKVQVTAVSSGGITRIFTLDATVVEAS